MTERLYKGFSSEFLIQSVVSHAYTFDAAQFEHRSVYGNKYLLVCNSRAEIYLQGCSVERTRLSAEIFQTTSCLSISLRGPKKLATKILKV